MRSAGVINRRSGVRTSCLFQLECRTSLPLHRVYVMGHGRIVFEGTPAELRENAAVRKEWLEV
jgi:ABC-type branched-subunit amino acid transport system ATPase component